jgi:hypothetical protein
MNGVQIPHSQTIDPDDRGEPLSVSHVIPAFVVPIKYYDKRGVPHKEMVFVMGDVVYHDPVGERWQQTLRPLEDKLAKDIVTRCNSHFQDMVRRAIQDMGLSVQPAVVAGNDEVDVIADQTDNDATPSAK